MPFALIERLMQHPWHAAYKTHHAVRTLQRLESSTVDLLTKQSAEHLQQTTFSEVGAAMKDQRLGQAARFAVDQPGAEQLLYHGDGRGPDVGLAILKDIFEHAEPVRAFCLFFIFAFDPPRRIVLWLHLDQLQRPWIYQARSRRHHAVLVPFDFLAPELRPDLNPRKHLVAQLPAGAIAAGHDALLDANLEPARPIGRVHRPQTVRVIPRGLIHEDHGIAAILDDADHVVTDLDMGGVVRVDGPDGRHSDVG